MSKTTTNYGLILEDDASTKFKDWREAINGATNSNFIEVDRILAEKGNKSASVECTLVASSWVGVDAPFTQELVVTGLGSVQNGNISVAHSATFAFLVKQLMLHMLSSHL